ncbi:MAG: GTPase Era, partial [Campylobacteraceae bacterium]|nr:GTPase Era [Campylobacteraceae bacterium]
MSTRTGFVAVVGKPNAGKSTLLNWLVGEKIAMVSQKANATRKRSLIIAMHDDNQIIFIDTPGLHQKEKILNKFMLEEALKAIGDCDAILFLAPITDTIEAYESFLALKPKAPHIVLLTKTDLVSKEKIFKVIEMYQKFQTHFKALIPVSVKRGISQSLILDEILKIIPKHPHLYDPENLTNAPMRELYREFIREAIFENMSDEIPYCSDVIVEEVEELYDLEKIYATIIIEKPSQKGMIIGKSGASLRRIGKHARLMIEKLCQK